MPSSTIIQQTLRRPILILLPLSIQPNQPISQQIINDRLRAGLLPAQIQLEHGDAYEAENLNGFEDGGLVGVELFGDRADVLFVADEEEGEAGAERIEGLDGAEDVVSIF